MDSPSRRISKIFNDPVHGHISIHPLCVKIIDTPEFQRLRFIKQLGPVYFVYPGAAHNRFEHSLGVCHLAGRLVKTLKKNQPELEITDADVLCLEIAGLCHDLGHGPFSHLFQYSFLPKMWPDLKWTHEENSVKMFDYLITKNNLIKDFEEYHISEKDREFIREIIARPDVSSMKSTRPEIYRNKRKMFLYEIVSNERNGIDVDKWDYFARDCLMLGIRNTFEYTRCLKFVRAIQVDGQWQICFRDKENGNFYDMFAMRAKLHRKAYQHKTSYIIGEMIVEALVKANDHVTFEGIDGKQLKLHETIHDIKAFSNLTDDIINLIMCSPKKELAEPANLLRNITSRQFYKFVAEKQPKFNTELQAFNHITTALIAQFIPSSASVTTNDLVIQRVRLDYGMQAHNPVLNVRFYSKYDLNTAKEEETKMFLPERFNEELIRIYSKKTDDYSCGIIKDAFEKALDSNGEIIDDAHSDRKRPDQTFGNRCVGE